MSTKKKKMIVRRSQYEKEKEKENKNKAWRNLQAYYE